MTSGLGGLAPFFRRILPLLNGNTPFFQPNFGHFWPPVNGFLPSPSGWDCSDFTKEEISIKIKDSVCMDKLYTKNTIDITSENLD